MTDPDREPAHRRHAWILLFLAAAFFLPMAVNFALFIDPGPDRAFWEARFEADPGLEEQVRLQFQLFGTVLVGFSLLGMALAAVPYRRGERWSWYVAWTLVGVYGVLAFQALEGGTSGAPFVLPALPLLGLLLPLRTFFPKKRDLQATRRPPPPE